MAKLKIQLFFMLLLGTTLAAPSQAEDVIDTALYEGLEWRESALGEAVVSLR